MKKILLITVLALMLFSLVACGDTPAVDNPPETKPKNIMQKSDPAEDDVFNLLMVGHSGCYYYTDELYNVAKAAGVKMRVCNVYYSGCPLENHWNWWKNGEAHYDFFVIDDNGKQYLIQIKRRTSATKTEGITGLRELIGVKVLEDNVSGCIFVTTADHFSSPAKTYAQQVVQKSVVESFDLYDCKEFLKITDLVKDKLPNSWSSLLKL